MSAYAEGDELYAFLGIERGGYADYVIVKEGEASRKPRTLSTSPPPRFRWRAAPHGKVCSATVD